MPLDVFSSMRPPSWRGIPFPMTSLHNAFTHDQVEHKFMFMAGAHVETTGRNPFAFQARIPFNNAVRPANFEPWAGQVLYPDLFDKFMVAVLDGSTGDFVHPNFGTIKCKAKDVEWDFLGNGPRDGAMLSCRFVHTIDDIDALQDALTPTSALGRAQANADALDKEITAAGPLPELANDKQSFGDMMVDYASGGGNLGRIFSKLDNTDSALTRLDSVEFWPLRLASSDMRYATYDLTRAPPPDRGNVREFVVPGFTTLPALAIRLRVRTDDLVRMNPGLARDPAVPVGSRVRYMQSSR